MTKQRIGFTGTQKGMSDKQKEALKNFLGLFNGEFELHHGDCVGADAEAHEIALELGGVVVIHPPEDWSKRAFCEDCIARREEKPYLQRNHEIVDECHNLVAAPLTDKEVLRSGTWATIRYAKKTFKRINILPR